MSALNVSSFIWGIADDVLRDVYVRGKYRDVILPMTVIRRLDAVLEPTKDAVLRMKDQLDDAGITNQDAALRPAAGEAFYNVSPFRLRDLTSRGTQQQLRADFEAYLDGFSPNVQEVLEKFKFRNQIPTLVEADALGFLIEKFLDSSINLSPRPVLNGDGSVRLEGLDNHGMGTVFEELIRRFNEENNEEAGEHFTPRDVVQLMARLVFLPIADEVTSGTYLVYDGACGTGGMLTVAEETLTQLAGEQGKEVSVHLYGQEVNPETYAISKADLILKGEGVEADNIRFGSTLSNDGFPASEFDFMLSNPPYGKSWKTDLERMGGKTGLWDMRFIVDHADDPDYSLATRSSDGQMMFLANMLSKMKQDTPLGVIPTSLVDKDPHGWGAVQRGVGPMLIVGGNPGRQGLEAGRVAEIEAHVGPLREQGLDEALGFAIGLRAVGTGDQVARAELDQARAEGGGPGVAPGAVRHDGLDPHAARGKEGRSLGQEAGGGGAALVGVGLHKGHARAVVNGHVQEVVAAPAAAAALGPAPDAMPATRRDAPQLLHIQMQQLPRLLAGVAHGPLRGPVQVRQPRDPMSPQHAVDRGAGQAQVPGQAVRPPAVLPARPQDALLHRARQRMGAAPGDRRAVEQTGRAFGSIAAQPPIARLARDLQGLRRRGHRPPLVQHPIHQHLPPIHVQARSTMRHESLLSAGSVNTPCRVWRLSSVNQAHGKYS